MEQAIEFLNNLIEKLSDVSWSISEIVEFKEVTEGEEIYAELSDGSTFEKQDDWYITQIQHGDDWFSGTIIYPITDSKAALINYSC